MLRLIRSVMSAHRPGNRSWRDALPIDYSRRLFRSLDDDRRRPAWNQRENRAQNDDDSAKPDPFHERIQGGVNYGLTCFGAASGVYDIEIFAKRGINRDHCSGFLTTFVGAFFRIEHHYLALALVGFDGDALRGVVALRNGIKCLADESVRADFHGGTSGHFHLLILIKCLAGNSNENENDSKMHYVSAVAASVSHGKLDRRSENIFSAAGANYFRATVELRDDRESDEGGEDYARERKQICAAEWICDCANY